MRELLKSWTPPALQRWMLRARSGPPMRYDGPFATWQEAAAQATGYGAAAILERARAAALRVRTGEIAAERDSVPLLRAEPPMAVIAGLLRAAVADGGRLSVLDFGGALGTTLHACRPLLRDCGSLRWSVVEQAHFVRCGRDEFTDETLRFHDTIEACVREERPNAALLSGVLHYLPDPFAVLASIAAAPIGTVIIDRTPFSGAAEDRIAVQRVPPAIYDASYPMHVFARPRFVARLPASMEVLAEFDSPVDAPARLGPLPFHFRGMILRRR